MFKTSISRRKFLQGLAAFGAAVVMPSIDASESEINQVWEKLLTEPITFEVDEYNTISMPWIKFPETNADIYYDVNTAVESTDQLLSEIQSYSQLSDRIASEFEYMACCPGENTLVDELVQKDLGWEEWILKGNLNEHIAQVESWLNESIDWDYAPVTVGPVGEAYQYFNNFAWSTHEDLGIVVIEGEHPGSSYYAAELRVPLEEANNRAQSLGLPIRFVSV